MGSPNAPTTRLRAVTSLHDWTCCPMLLISMLHAVSPPTFVFNVTEFRRNTVGQFYCQQDQCSLPRGEAAHSVAVGKRRRTSLYKHPRVLDGQSRHDLEFSRHLPQTLQFGPARSGGGSSGGDGSEKGSTSLATLSRPVAHRQIRPHAAQCW
jgi:hypothetical protein